MDLYHCMYINPLPGYILLIQVVDDMNSIRYMDNGDQNVRICMFLEFMKVDRYIILVVISHTHTHTLTHTDARTRFRELRSNS